MYYLESSILLSWCCKNTMDITTAAHKKLQGTTRVPGPCSYCVTLMPSKRGPDSAPRPSWPDCMAGQGAWGNLKKPPFSTTTIGNASPKTCVPRATTVTDSIRVRWAPGWVSGRNGMSPQVTDAVLPCTEQGLQGTAWDTDPLLFPALICPLEVQTESSKGDTWLCWALLPTQPEKAEMTTTPLSDNLVTGEHWPTKWMTISQFPLLSTITIQAFLHPPTYTLRLSLFLLQICLPVWAQLSFCHPQSWWLGNINHNEKCGFECLQAEKSIRSRCFPMLSKNASHYAYSQWQAEVPPIRVTFLCWQLQCFVVNSELCIQAKTGWKCGFQVSSC